MNTDLGVAGRGADHDPLVSDNPSQDLRHRFRDDAAGLDDGHDRHFVLEVVAHLRRLVALLPDFERLRADGLKLQYPQLEHDADLVHVGCLADRPRGRDARDGGTHYRRTQHRIVEDQYALFLPGKPLTMASLVLAAALAGAPMGARASAAIMPHPKNEGPTSAN
jgi:hypothetical protein